MAKSFRDLKIWQKAYGLLMRVYDITAKYSPGEKYNLNQPNSTVFANGVLGGITETHGRYYFADKARALYIAQGECSETQSHLSQALGRGYISKKEFEELDKEY